MTKIVHSLSEFQLLCNATETELLTAKEPLSVFFASCGKLHEQASDQVKNQIADRLQTALNGFEKWIPMSESPPAIFKIHIVIALIIFSCSPIVYVRVSAEWDDSLSPSLLLSHQRHTILINSIFVIIHFSQSRHASSL